MLDTPQEMELQSGDPVGAPRSDTVRVISVAYAEGLEQYDGQHLTFSIDPEATYWPSDTSMPGGTARYTGCPHFGVKESIV